MSRRNSTSAENNSSLSVVADKPTFLLPASTPNVIGCLYPLEPYNNCIVNGLYDTIFAFSSFSNFRALLGLHGINGAPCLFCTYTNIKCFSFFRSYFPFPNVTMPSQCG
jgi:hypothetical protein